MHAGSLPELMTMATRLGLLPVGVTLRADLPPGWRDDVLHLLDLPDGAEVLGPVPVHDEHRDDEHRVLLRVPRSNGADLSGALGDLQRVRSARKLDPVRIQVDPLTI